jgi:hypothetical protein
MLKAVYRSPTTVTVAKYRKLHWAGYVTRIEDKDANRILVGKQQSISQKCNSCHTISRIIPSAECLTEMSINNLIDQSVKK